MLSKKNVGHCEIKGQFIICQNKKIAKLMNAKQYVKDGSVVQILYKDDKSKTIHLKVEKNDYIGGGQVFPYYDNVVDDKIEYCVNI